jgi:hypothetical protein
MLKFLIGFTIGYLVVAIGQLGIEKEAVKNGIIKLCGKYYTITHLKKNDGGEC